MDPHNIIVTHTVGDNPPVNPGENVTRGMMRERAVELAVMNGRPAHEASKSDWEAAKRELNGKDSSSS